MAVAGADGEADGVAGRGAARAGKTHDDGALIGNTARFPCDGMAVGQRVRAERFDDVHGDLHGTFGIEQQVFAAQADEHVLGGRCGKPDVGGGDAGKRRAVSFSPSVVAGIMFMDGEPMNWATNTEAGCR